MSKKLSKAEIRNLVARARKLAREKGYTLTAVGSGLYRLEGEEHLQPPSMVVKTLEKLPTKQKVRKVRSDKGKTHSRRVPATTFIAPST
jgi:hypothetical protein